MPPHRTEGELALLEEVGLADWQEGLTGQILLVFTRESGL